MEPTFHLEGIIRSKEEMQDFEGPLNLILQLLSKNKVEIRDIQVSQILDQYMDYLAEMQELDLEIASEFAQMASHLLYIKTKTLLSGEKEVTELEVLMQSLEELKNRDAYAAIRAVAPLLEQSLSSGGVLFSRPREQHPKYKTYAYRHQPVELLRALLHLYVKEDEPAAARENAPVPLIPRPIPYGVREKGEEILSRLRDWGAMKLTSLYAISQSRSELVATVLAILELCSMGNLAFTENEAGELIVSLTEAAETEENMASALEMLGEPE